MMANLVPQQFHAVERLRYMGQEFGPHEIPEDFSSTPIGRFQVRVDGKWHRCHGSWMSDVEPMVWREEEPLQ